LPSLVAATKQQYTYGSNHGVIDAISRPPIDSQFKQPPTEGLGVAEIPGGKAIDPNRDLRLRPCIGQIREPMIERISSAGTNVMPYFNHSIIVTYKSHIGYWVSDIGNPPQIPIESVVVVLQP
jgi:hypothetical protein